jgi:hypothetical protein
MEFTAKEVCEIVRKHIIAEWQVPAGAIGKVAFHTYQNGSVSAEVKTNEQLGGPYRSAPQGAAKK